MGAKYTNEKITAVLLWLIAGFIIAVLFGIIIYVMVKGVSVINWEFLTSAPRRAGKEGGISTPIIGTLYLTLVSLLIAVPIGVGGAIYLEEYSRKESIFTRLVNLTAETLAGVPSIIFGLFGFVFFVLFLGWGWSILSGATTLAMMILPTITRTTQEAILAVSSDYRENSLALGATKWQTIRKLILPTALPGIITGVILSIGRAIGETAAIILTAGSSMGMPVSIFDPARTMTVHLYMLAMEGLSMEKAFGTACLIIVLIVIINYLAHLSLNRFVKSLS